MQKNITTNTDIYKIGHWKCLPDDYDGSYMNGEPRIGAKYNELVWVGLDPIIQKHFMTPVTDKLITLGKRRIDKMMGPYDMYNDEVWKKVRDLGYLPLRIKALPEG